MNDRSSGQGAVQCFEQKMGGSGDGFARFFHGFFDGESKMFLAHLFIIFFVDAWEFR